MADFDDAHQNTPWLSWIWESRLQNGNPFNATRKYYIIRMIVVVNNTSLLYRDFHRDFIGGTKENVTVSNHSEILALAMDEVTIEVLIVSPHYFK